MLDLVAAVRFDREMQSGKTRPCLLSCLRSSGDEIELVSKYSAGCERDIGALVAEAIAAMIAADLGLPVPEPFLVELEPEFLAAVQAENSEMAERMRVSASIAFGSMRIEPGFASLPLHGSIPLSLRTQAAEIFAFDTLIQNPDRRPDNPNCLSNGDTYAIFDHEFAFLTDGIIGWRPPWKAGGLNIGPSDHVFYAGLKGSNPLPDFHRFEQAFKLISPSRVEEYRATLPGEWAADGGVSDKSLNYVTQLIENIDAAMAEVVKVLT